LPLSWTVSHDERLVIATGTGEVVLMDLLAFAKAIAQAGLLAYPRIFDLSHATMAVSAAEIRNIAQGVAAATANGSLGTIGAVAFIAKSDEVRDITTLFGDRTAKTPRPVRVCSTMAEARAWLADLECRPPEEPS
jgi:hypothetical protein